MEDNYHEKENNEKDRNEKNRNDLELKKIRNKFMESSLFRTPVWCLLGMNTLKLLIVKIQSYFHHVYLKKF